MIVMTAGSCRVRYTLSTLATYGALTALLVDYARRRLGHRAAVCLGVVPAGVADAAEGVALLIILASKDIDANARGARRTAIAKFVVSSPRLCTPAAATYPCGRACNAGQESKLVVP